MKWMSGKSDNATEPYLGGVLVLGGASIDDAE